MKTFQQEVQKRFDYISSLEGQLFRSSVTGDEIVKTYLESFEEDPIFRDPSSSTHNCNHCIKFLNRYGNIISITKDNLIVTLFDFVPSDEEFVPVANSLSILLKNKPVKSVFVETFTELNSLPYEKCNSKQDNYQLGTLSNVKIYSEEEAEVYPETVLVGKVYEFNHLSLSINRKFIDFSGAIPESIAGKTESSVGVFQRAMEEISEDSYITIIDLINQGSLLSADSHLEKLKTMLKFKKEYDTIENDFYKSNWCWRKALTTPYSNFKNELIGTTCHDLSKGTSLEKVCEDWNKRVDPVNYKKAVAPFTERQKQSAMKLVKEGGYENSFIRRFATLDDIKVSEIKYLGSSGSVGSKPISIFDNLKTPVTSNKKVPTFEGLPEVTIDKFMKDILPTSSEVEIFFSNKHVNNLLSLTTSTDETSKPMFKWDNNYIGTFIGNLSGKSELSEQVSARGGRIDGAFRFTHSWNELEPNQSLMDLHVFFPGNNNDPDGCHDRYGTSERVGWNRRSDVKTKGVQDVDYTQAAPKGFIPVENITFPDISLMPEGEYTCKIHNWSFRSTGGKGRAEIAFDGKIFQYIYPATRNKEWITVAKVTLKNGKFSIKHILPELNTSKKVYNLDTEKFHKVNLVCLSPNYWGQNAFGVKYYYFMIEGCKPDNPIRTYHVDGLNEELYKERKVLEPLAGTLMIEPEDNQLSGIGFNSTVRDSVIVKVKGTTERVLKLNF